MENVIIVGSGETAEGKFIIITRPYWETEQPVHELIAAVAVEMANLCGCSEFTVSRHEINA